MAEAYEMWDLLSGPKVSSEVRAKVGRYMHKHTISPFNNSKFQLSLRFLGV